MRTKLNNLIVDQKLLDSPVKRIGNILGSIIKNEWQCNAKNCNYIWTATPNSILSKKSGCPKCAGNMPLTNRIVDEMLFNNNILIKRKGNYTNNEINILWECTIDNCKYCWLAKPRNILNKSRGCPKCSKRLKLTNEIVDEILLSTNRLLKRVSDIIRGDVKNEWECLVENCFHHWQAAPNSILSHKSGCPACKHKNEKIISKTLKEHNIKFELHKDIRKINILEKRRCGVDFYISDQNLIIEYNGGQHYFPVTWGVLSKERAEINFAKQQERDVYIKNFCQDSNIQLLVIDGRIYKNNILQEYISKIIRDFK